VSVTVTDRKELISISNKISSFNVKNVTVTGMNKYSHGCRDRIDIQ